MELTPDADSVSNSNGEASLGEPVAVRHRGCPSQDNPPADEENSYRLHRRFDRVGRLVGDRAMAKLFRSHVVVVGVGGVGSFAAESLSRSGVGKLTLIDFDRVCITNTNRQLMALQGTVGKSKAQVLAERLQLINPQATVAAVPRFYSAELADELFALEPDYVIDAIDNITAKCHLLSQCRARGIKVVSSLGAAGRMDPTAITIADLAHTKFDPMALDVRRILRRKYGFPERGLFGIDAVYSLELPQEPIELTYDEGQGFRCVCPGGKNTHHSCEDRRRIYGTASFVTGSFGLFCASVVVRSLVSTA